MSREVGITAISHLMLKVDEQDVTMSNAIYNSKDWIEKVLEQNQDHMIEGRLILACSYDAHRWILEAVRKLNQWGAGAEIFITDEDDIFAPPGRLLELLQQFWDEWHSEDPRWSWSQETIKEFFDLYKWAIIYIDVY